MTNPDPGPSGRLKVALVFPPAMTPTSPPLGVAALKSFLLSPPAEACVKVFDLNLAHYRQALRWMESGRLKMSLRKAGHEESARGVREAVGFFRGNEGLGAFLDIGRYNTHAQLYTSFEAVLNALFEDFARKSLLGLPAPALASEYFSELIAPVLDFAPDLAGFSLLFSQQLFFAIELAARCRKAGAKTVLGGATLSVMPNPERLLCEPARVRTAGKSYTARLDSAIDYLIVGEGEAGLAALAKSRADEAALPDIPGLAYMRRGRPKINPPSAVRLLDSLPAPDFDDFDLSQYHSPVPVLHYLSARGCCWKRCAFCTHRKTYLDYREEDVQTTAERLCALGRKYGVYHFNLVDEMIHPRRFARLAEAVAAKAPDIRYSAYAKPRAGFVGLFEKLRGSGLRVLLWGVESGNQRMLDAMKKGTRKDEMAEVLQSAHAAGIWNLVFALFGFPGETAEEWRETVDFLENNKEAVDALSRSRFVLLEGSDVFLHPEKYDVTRVIGRPQRDPVSIAYDYEVRSGLSREEVKTKFPETRPLLSRIGRSPHFAQFRDHLLIYAANKTAHR